MTNENLEKMADLMERKANTIKVANIRYKEAQRTTRLYHQSIVSLRLLEDEIAELSAGDASFYTEYSEIRDTTVQPLA